MSTADLDISLERWEDASAYVVELRLSLPSSESDIAPVRGKVQLDLERLYQHTLDTEAYGQLLTRALLADPAVREFFSNARVSAQALNVPLRLRLCVSSSAPELHNLRWETLRDLQRNVSFVTNQRVLFSRLLSSPDFRPVRLRPPGDLRALVMVANPTDLGSYRPGGKPLAPLDVPGELSRAQNGLGAIPITALPSNGRATLNDLCSELREGHDIVYLICHGALVDGHPWLWLERDNGKTARVSGEELAARLSEIQQPPTLVVLASCQSAGAAENSARGDEGTMASLGPRLAEAGIPAVLAIQGSISMETAAAFMPVFFQELRRDGQIDRATAAARGSVREREDSWMPALFMSIRSGCIWREVGGGEPPASLRIDQPALSDVPERPGPRPVDPSSQAEAPSVAGPAVPIREPRRAVSDPVEAKPSRWNNLPRQLTSFVGREKEAAEVKKLLSETCLLTLTGSGGCGKTRLALQVAGELLDQYEGVGLVELAALSEPALVPQTVATALEVREETGRTPTETLISFLKDKSFLLLLDNCEHLVSACAELADLLLRRCAGLRILASSREDLDTAGEMTYRVPSLALPDPRRLPPVERLLQYEAVRLFVERAVFVQPRFALTADNGPSVVGICRRLDGIPLAIELAAARVKVLSAEQIAARLDDRFRLLTGGSRTALKHQQTLRALIDWSYDLLSEAERTLLIRLSVFAGSWTLEAAEAVCAGGEVEAWEVLDLLTELVDKSLVVSEELEGAARYHLLQTMRQYCWERLEERGEGAAGRSHHRDFFLQLAEEAEPQLRGQDQEAWLERLEVEHDNLRAAIGWSVERGDAEAGLCLGAALWWFWHIRGHLREGGDRLHALLALPASCGCDLARARALNGAGALADDQGDYAGAARYHEEALAIARACSDQETMAYALFSLGTVSIREQRYQQAEEFCRQALALWRASGNQSRVAQVLSSLGWALQRLGRLEEAVPVYEESLTLKRQLGGQIAVANTLNNLGGMALDQKDYDRAAALLIESLSLSRRCDYSGGISVTLNNIARLAAIQGHLPEAACLLAEVKELCETMGAALPEDYQENVATVRTAIGEERFFASEQQALAMTLDQVVGCAIDIAQAAPAQSH